MAHAGHAFAWHIQCALAAAAAADAFCCLLRVPAPVLAYVHRMLSRFASRFSLVHSPFAPGGPHSRAAAPARTHPPPPPLLLHVPAPAACRGWMRRSPPLPTFLLLDCARRALSVESSKLFFLLVEKDTVSFTRTCSLEALKCHFVNAACCTSPPVAQSSTSSAAKRCARTRAAAASAWAADAPGWGAGPAGAQLPRPAHPATNACREAFEPRRCLGRWRPPEKLRALVRGAQLGSLSASERP